MKGCKQIVNQTNGFCIKFGNGHEMTLRKVMSRKGHVYVLLMWNLSYAHPARAPKGAATDWEFKSLAVPRIN